jgi:hypothetical protein
LRSIVFVGEPDLGLGFDVERIGLGAMSGGDEAVVGALCGGEAGGALGGVMATRA